MFPGNIKIDFRSVDHRVIAHGGQVIPIQRDIKGAYRNLNIFNFPNLLGNPCSQGNAPGTDAHQGHIFHTPVLFRNFMGDTDQRATDAVCIHNRSFFNNILHRFHLVFILN